MRSTLEVDDPKAVRGEVTVRSRHALTADSIFGGAVPIEGEAEESGNGAATAETPAQATEPTWVAIRMVDGLGDPAKGVKYEIELPGGSKKEGALDDSGMAKVSSPTKGSCKISFPEIDAGDWDRG